ncbi:Smr/MutS family protein [Candidatus Zixiibacteriota bacterium]
MESELNLRGSRVEEALALLSQFIAEAAQQGRGRVKIIHGKGMRSPDGFSVVRESVKRYLEQALEDGTIRDFRLGNVGEGGAGVTIVWL